MVAGGVYGGVNPLLLLQREESLLERVEPAVDTDGIRLPEDRGLDGIRRLLGGRCRLESERPLALRRQRKPPALASARIQPQGTKCVAQPRVDDQRPVTEPLVRGRLMDELRFVLLVDVPTAQ